MPRVLEPLAILVPDNGGAFAAFCPVTASRIAACGREHALRVRGPGENVVVVHGIAPAAHRLPPFSVNAVSLVMLFASECRSSMLLATTVPLAFCQGPLPDAVARHRHLRPPRARSCSNRHAICRASNPPAPGQAPGNGRPHRRARPARAPCPLPTLPSKRMSSPVSRRRRRWYLTQPTQRRPNNTNKKSTSSCKLLPHGYGRMTARPQRFHTRPRAGTSCARRM